MGNYDLIKQALRDNSDDVIETVAHLIVMLGAKYEWDMEDNFHTTETIAGLSQHVVLPQAFNQGDDEIAFYGPIANELGYDTDYEIDEEE